MFPAVLQWRNGHPLWEERRGGGGELAEWVQITAFTSGTHS